MRKFFYGLGVFAAVAIIAGGIGLVFLVRNAATPDAESKAYVDDAMVAIIGNWNEEELVRRLSADAEKATPAEKVTALFETARMKLGPLVAYRGAEGTSDVFYSTDAGTRISARYAARATFRNGDADFRLVLLKIDGVWKIYSFSFQSTRPLRPPSEDKT